MNKTFLRAEWRKLAIINYAIDKSLLRKYLPDKTELDIWNDTCYVSLVGFMFKNTKLQGIKVPFHINFEEINLRFYVRYNDQGNWKRGVVFIREIVPKPTLTFVANTFYKENYTTMPMSHSWIHNDDHLAVTYKWKKKQWNSIEIITDKTSSLVEKDSLEEFITEHYWGYTKISDTQTSEYQVEHPRWEVYPIKDYKINVDFEDVYGKDFGFLIDETPRSVFLAEGSEIVVRKGRKL